MLLHKYGVLDYEKNKRSYANRLNAVLDRVLKTDCDRLGIEKTLSLLVHKLREPEYSKLPNDKILKALDMRLEEIIALIEADADKQDLVEMTFHADMIRRIYIEIKMLGSL